MIQIENIKCKIAGNQQFHSRLAYQALDQLKKNQINATHLTRALNAARFQQNQTNCTLFLRKYSKNGAMTYDEYLTHYVDF